MSADQLANDKIPNICWNSTTIHVLASYQNSVKYMVPSGSIGLGNASNRVKYTGTERRRFYRNGRSHLIYLA
ncbi:MAG: hypothetical protein HW403_1410 [Dehalococcoidia bacterium]|nr:hypothetical protein [Dehalococcoidia bacterium]